MAVEPLETYEQALRAHFAGLDLVHWWPARTRFEVIAGALLVQNTSWQNVALALARLRHAGKLSLQGVRGLSEAELGGLIRSSGTWRMKARRLRGFVLWLDRQHAGSLDQLFAQPVWQARRQLLAVDGIGAETADAILAYAGDKASWIEDAYTRRICARHDLVIERAAVETSPRRCRELHALLVETAKRYCRKRQPACGLCPLLPLLPAGGLK
ncbi:MAG: endonuclease III domain-containing protein [Terriglobales bacterium]